MSKSNPNATPLSKEEIEEELLNNELLNSGVTTDQEHLNELDMEDKKRLLASTNISRECNKFPALEIRNRLSFDHSSDNFPSLSEVAQRQQNKPKPRKSASSILVVSDDSQDGSVKLMDNEEEITTFKLPFCVSDGGPPLTMPERPFRRNNNPYYVKPNERFFAALKRMLTHHDAWKAEYTKEMSRLQAQDSGDTSDEVADEEISRVSRNSNDKDDSDEDPYLFKTDSSTVSSYKMLTNESKKNTNVSTDTLLQSNSRTLQRKTSRDSDCEEVDPILKPEEPKLSEWLAAGPNRPKSKRNKKQLLNAEKNKNPVEIEFTFESKWNPNSSSWGEQSSSATSLSSQPRRGLRSSPVVEEPKVQCPICQKNFGISKVENHAATCEGYSTSPMDVEEES